MDLITYKASLRQPLRQATLVFLIKSDSILLAMKKRGFGKGYWNGVGGKVESGETLEAAVIREAQEEIGVTPLSLKKVADLYFYFPEVPIGETWDQHGVVYECTSWEGEPHETEEMAPRWFRKEDIPYETMWPDDILWLPHVLEGKEVMAEFMFDTQNAVTDYNVKVK